MCGRSRRGRPATATPPGRLHARSHLGGLERASSLPEAAAAASSVNADTLAGPGADGRRPELGRCGVRQDPPAHERTDTGSASSEARVRLPGRRP